MKTATTNHYNFINVTTYDFLIKHNQEVFHKRDTENERTHIQQQQSEDNEPTETVVEKVVFSPKPSK